MAETKLQASAWQRNMWLEWQWDLASTAYNASLIYKIQGRLDEDALNKSLNILVNEHYEGMRTHFGLENKILLQVISDRIVPRIRKKIFELEDVDFEKESEQFIDEMLQEPFNLYEPQLFRCGLLKIGKENSVLVFCIHHSIIDGPYSKIFAARFAELYNYCASVEGSEKPSSPNVSMADYIEYDNKKDHAVLEREGIAYWLDLLKNKKLKVDIPLKKTEKQSGRIGKSIHFQLSKKESECLKKCAYSMRTTPFLLLSGIYAAFLSRYSNQECVAFHYPVNTRPKGFADLSGCFMNNVPVILEVDKDSTLIDLVASLTRQRKESRKYQELPFSKVIQALRKDNPDLEKDIFNALLIESNLVLEPLQLDDLQVTAIRPKNFELAYEFGLSYQVGEEIRFRLDYLDIFDSRLMGFLVNNFKVFLKACISSPDMNVFKLDMIHTNERKKIINKFNDTASSYDSDKTIADLFAQVVAKHPNKIAVVSNGDNISYLDLNIRANQLAHYLREYYQSKHQAPMPPGVHIASHFVRGINMIIAILGILKAGGVYLPIDPDIPLRRKEYILKDSNSAMLLTDSVSQPSVNIDCSTIFVDSIGGVELQFQNNPVSKNVAGDAAYTIYTSGSTGVPKGVSLPHTTITNLIDWQAKAGRKDDRLDNKVTQIAASGFDVSVQEIFYALLTGSELHVIPNAFKTDLVSLIDYLQKQRITEIFLATALLYYLCEACRQNSKSIKNLKLKNIFVAGEALKISKQIKDFFTSNKKVTLYNHYGPSETHVVTSDKLKGGKMRAMQNYRSIGKPINNTKLYVLNKQLQPVPIGCCGELYVSGMGLGNGYLNNTALTDASFIPNSFGVDGVHGRLYKTGDLVRWLSDGSIEFMGRNDSQIKIRGFRIEQKEVELQLLKYEDIEQNIVTVNKENNDQLVAYYVAKRDLQVDRLQKFLAKSLPSYMIPEFYVRIDFIPLTKNGKVDFLKLAAPIANKQVDDSYIGPRNQLEKQVAKLWVSSLGIKKTSIRNDFFSIGGNSLVAVQLLLEINEKITKHFSMRDLLLNPTIAGMAKIISDRRSNFEVSEKIVDLRKEASLDGSIKPPTGSREAPLVVNKVFLTDPGLRGDTATGGSKPATLETGAVVRVPLFINVGDTLKVDTRSGEYISRGK